jgi:hypothetical protein
VFKRSNGNLEVQHLNGSGYTIPACPYPTLHKKDLKRLHAKDTGWIEYGSFDGQDFDTFNGYWPVPTAPSASDGQIVYIFTGLENGAGDEIIQPVLQWGTTPAGGGNYWALASWWVTSFGQALWSSLVQTQAGATVYGTMKMTSPGNWTIVSNVQGGQSTTLKVGNVDPQAMSTVTLECYQMTGCTDYPASGSTTFTGLSLTDGGSPVSPTWTPNVDFTTCNENVNPVSSSVVILTY